jgi:hypothetical protein
MKLSPLVHQFFDQYLPSIRGVSPQTIKAYRDAFRLFLPFAASFYNIKIKSLRVEHIKRNFSFRSLRIFKATGKIQSRHAIIGLPPLNPLPK